MVVGLEIDGIYLQITVISECKELGYVPLNTNLVSSANNTIATILKFIDRQHLHSKKKIGPTIEPCKKHNVLRGFSLEQILKS